MRYLFPLSPWNQQRQYEKPVWVYPAHLAMYATYLKDKGNYVNWADTNIQTEWFNYNDKQLENEFDAKVVRDDFDIDVPFDQLPYPDRKFTDAKHPR